MATVIKMAQWTGQSGKVMDIKVSITHKVQDKTVNLDGDICNLGKETYDDIEITLIADGKVVEFSRYAPEVITETAYKRDYKQLRAKGAYAHLGNKYIGEDFYNAIMAVIADVEAEFATDAEYQEVKAAEIAKEAQQKELDLREGERYAQQIKNGLCPICGTYCHGDCQANK
jgi:hypothetical protein